MGGNIAMGLEIIPATDADYAIVANLARFYVYDMAEHAGWPFPPDGLLDVGDQFANYWGKSGAKHHWPPSWRGFAFLVRLDGNLAGFALVKRMGESTFDMGEFFVARQYRRHGVGRRVAFDLFDGFVGDWEVREMPTNIAAQAFWRRIIADYTGGAFREAREAFAIYDNKEFVVQRFRSRAPDEAGFLD
jgi:predicted acetyltransferase